MFGLLALWTIESATIFVQQIDNVMRSQAPILKVDLDAVASNYRTIQGKSAGAECASVVKANAYGLGDKQVVRRLIDEDCRTFFVAQVEEALGLAPIIAESGGRVFVLNGLSEDEISHYSAECIYPVLNTQAQIDLWASVGRGAPAGLHLDTGFGRFGLLEAEDENAAARVTESGFEIALLFSHFACADDPAATLNEIQFNRFIQRRVRFKYDQCSIANSAGVFASTDFHLDLVRPGLALYGGQPINGEEIPTKSAISWCAPIRQIQTVLPGESIGYGATVIAKSKRQIGIVGAGYADGLPVAFSNCGHVTCQGERAQIIGRVSMDSFAIDLTEFKSPHALQSKWVEIYGPALDVNAQARTAQCLNYELLTRIGGRTRREYAP